MLFSAFILVSVEREHDSLEKGINFRKGDETAKSSDVSGFGLEKEEKVGVLLHLAIVGEVTFGSIDIFEVFFDFVLLM